MVKSGQDDLSQTLYSQKWPKSVFEIVVRIERKKISAVNVPNGVSDVPIGTSQFCRCCATIKSEKVSATNDRLLSFVHRMFTNTYPAFCRGNVRCKVKGGLEQQRARFAHSVPSESCWGVPSPNPAIRSLTAAATSPSDRALQALSPRKVLKTARTATSSRSQHRRIFLTGILNKRQISVR